jgi:hypothetical protein
MCDCFGKVGVVQMTPQAILHIAHSDYAMGIVETGDNGGFKAANEPSRAFVAALKTMGWKPGDGWCNYWSNSVWWRAYAPSLPDSLGPLLRRALDEMLNEKDTLGLWNTKDYLKPLCDLGMKAYLFEDFPFYTTNVRGSLVIFSCDDADDNTKGKEDHIGLVLEDDDNGITCIEGNAGDALRITYRPYGSPAILGFITPLTTLPEWNNYTLPETEQSV